VEVFVFVEGQTEEAFVNRLLGPHLAPRGVHLHPILPGKPSTSGTRGGGVPTYRVLKRDLLRELSSDTTHQVMLTTMIDLYGLPSDYPGHSQAASLTDPHVRAKHIEHAMLADVGDARLMPYLQVHEFEALLLAEPESIAVAYPDHEAQALQLAADVKGFANPELIDDGPQTHPSARIAARIPRYGKVAGGELVALAIGLERMRERCPHFAEWPAALEALASEGPGC